MKLYFYTKVDCLNNVTTTSKPMESINDCYFLMVQDMSMTMLPEKLIMLPANCAEIMPGLAISIADPDAETIRVCGPSYHYTLHEMDVGNLAPAVEVEIPGYGKLFAAEYEDEEGIGIDLLLKKQDHTEVVARVERGSALRSDEEEFHAYLWADIEDEEPTHRVPFANLRCDEWPEFNAKKSN